KGVLALPWDRRHQLGTVRAFFQTSWACLIRPTMTFATAGAGGSLGSSVLFAALTGLCATSTTAVMYALTFSFGLFSGLEQSHSGFRWQSVLGALGFGLVTAASGVVYNIGSMVVLGSFEHLCLKIVGAQPKSWSVTMRG